MSPNGPAASKKPPFRADHVGSLRRPEKLNLARERLFGEQTSSTHLGPHDNAELREIENDCIRNAIKLQEDSGLKSISDGEFRRRSWWLELVMGWEGISADRTGTTELSWRSADGSVKPFSRLWIKGPIRWRESVPWLPPALLAALLTISAVTSASAETLKLAIGQKGAWNAMIPEWGQRKGFFREADLSLEILYTAGTGETQQAVIGNSVDIGLGIGTLGVLGAAAQGAPIRVISSEFIGSPDLIWYVPADSTIQTLKDAAGKSIAFSTVGSSTQLVIRKLLEQSGVTANLVATGIAPATLTSTMSKQVDVGWSVAPFAFEKVDKGEIRIVARGRDVTEFSDQSVRVIAVHDATTKSKNAALKRFMKAYQKTIDWMYSNEEAIQWFAEENNVTFQVAKRAVEECEPKSALSLGEMRGIDLSIRQAIEFKRLSRPMTEAEVTKMLAIIDPAKD